MTDRFQILKSKQLDGIYAVLDTHVTPAMIIATADSVREAKYIKEDVERMIKEDEAVDRAMIEIGLYE